MFEWILTTGGIAGLSVTALALFSGSGEQAATAESHEPTGAWQTMTEAELDALLAEFSRSGNEDRRPDLRLAA